MNRSDMRNYGPDGYVWELWHEGKVLDRENVVLVHGYRLPFSTIPGRCDEQFANLDRILQSTSDFNVWQFEYVGGPWGTYDSVNVYASRLDAALARVSEITGNETCSMVGYSMGGLIARQYLAGQGGQRVDKLLTLATPHMGVLHLEPFNIPYNERLYPRAGLEMRPDSRLLWDLNTDIESSCVTEFASLCGHSWGNGDGAVEMGSASLVQCGGDGSVRKQFYFAGVPRFHTTINRIKKHDDEVFQLLHGFLRGGVEGISRVRSPETPGEYGVPFFLTFSARCPPGARKYYPYVVVSKTGRCYRGSKIWSQGARAANGAQIYTVHLRSEEDGEARIYYSPGEYAPVRLQAGQSVVVAQPVGLPALSPAVV